jgi:LAO/AO transport system kinase
LKLLGRSDHNHKVAVIPVDPSSPISRGSILGDKTRMEILSNTDRAYIRASPTRGILGGVAEKTNDVLFLCTSAGYDICIVESVGLGQSEVEIDQVVDLLLLVIPPGGGDDLQASKKGIVEAADMILVNKADGDLLPLARSK